MKGLVPIWPRQVKLFIIIKEIVVLYTLNDELSFLNKVEHKKIFLISTQEVIPNYNCHCLF